MNSVNLNFFETEINWKVGRNLEFPFRALVNGEEWIIRMNDFPEDDFYTLIINAEEVADFNDWPKKWERRWDWVTLVRLFLGTIFSTH